MKNCNASSPRAKSATSTTSSRSTSISGDSHRTSSAAAIHPIFSPPSGIRSPASAPQSLTSDRSPASPSLIRRAAPARSSFAALNILEPLYEACLDRMEGLLADARVAKGADWKPPLYSHLAEFEQVLSSVADHPNERYFIYKSIILHNLYGVDIMEEAVEICKLRLFLKLAAQVEPDSGLIIISRVAGELEGGLIACQGLRTLRRRKPGQDLRGSLALLGIRKMLEHRAGRRVQLAGGDQLLFQGRRRGPAPATDCRSSRPAARGEFPASACSSRREPWRRAKAGGRWRRP